MKTVIILKQILNWFQNSISIHDINQDINEIMEEAENSAESTNSEKFIVYVNIQEDIHNLEYDNYNEIKHLQKYNSDSLIHLRSVLLKIKDEY